MKNSYLSLTTNWSESVSMSLSSLNWHLTSKMWPWTMSKRAWVEQRAIRGQWPFDFVTIPRPCVSYVPILRLDRKTFRTEIMTSMKPSRTSCFPWVGQCWLMTMSSGAVTSIIALICVEKMCKLVSKTPIGKHS